MAKLSGNYEVVFILNPNLDEEARRPEYIGLFDRKGAGFFCSKSPPTIPD